MCSELLYYIIIYILYTERNIQAAAEDISATIYEHVYSEEKLVIKIEMTEAVYEIACSPQRGRTHTHTYTSQ